VLYLKAICYAIIHRWYDILDALDRLHWRFNDWAEDTVAFHEGGYEARELVRAKRIEEMMAFTSEAQHEQNTIPYGEDEG